MLMDLQDFPELESRPLGLLGRGSHFDNVRRGLLQITAAIMK
jgi:hypothetical protein